MIRVWLLCLSDGSEARRCSPTLMHRGMAWAGGCGYTRVGAKDYSIAFHMFKESFGEMTGGDAQEPEVDYTPETENAASFEELFDIIRRAGTVRGTSSEHSVGELLSTIEAVRQGHMQLNSVTRSNGYRAAVERLMEAGHAGEEQEKPAAE